MDREKVARELLKLAKELTGGSFIDRRTPMGHFKLLSERMKEMAWDFKVDSNDSSFENSGDAKIDRARNSIEKRLLNISKECDSLSKDMSKLSDDYKVKMMMDMDKSRS
jgi:hypothetical protein